MVPRPASALLQACINLQTQLTAMFGCKECFCVFHDWIGVWTSFPAVSEVSDSTDTQDAFVIGQEEEEGSQNVDFSLPTTQPPPTPQQTHIHTHYCWQQGLEMLTHRVKSSPKKPHESPPVYGGWEVEPWNALGGVRVTYLLDELSEPCLSQILPPRPVFPTSSFHFPLFFCCLTYTNATHVLPRTV